MVSPEKRFSAGSGLLDTTMMRINVKLYGELKKYAPGDQNSFELAIETEATIADVLKILSIPTDHHISLINGRRATQEARFEDGDMLVLFPPISGG